ncbi:MAG: aldo/keto reductase [Verrucomicrobiaceae bacterium]|nr:aldo/keto reductase [Verrucomicrobiaceae bacterium]
MLKRILGKSGYEVSEVGFGAWQIGADWGDEVSREAANEALHAAVDAGVNFIDTADVYGGGRSESIIGEFIGERQEQIYVATKMGRATESWDSGYDEVSRAAEASCKRLGVDCLDLVQLHCIPEETLHAGHAFESLEKIKQSGLIRQYGVSVETIDEGLFCIGNSDAVSLQVIFNIFRQRVVTSLLPVASEKKIGIIARVPLASGLLSGRFSKGHEFGENDHRRFNCDGQLFNVGETFAGVPFSEGVDLAERVEFILAGECGNATSAQKSLRWVLDHDSVTTVIPGAKNALQSDENANVSGIPPLSGEVHANLLELYDSRIDSRVRGRY